MGVICTIALIFSLLGLLDSAKHHRQWDSHNNKGRRRDDVEYRQQQDSPSYTDRTGYQYSRPGYGSYPSEPRASPEEGVYVHRKQPYKNRNRRSESPNIIFIITDDQDISLGE